MFSVSVIFDINWENNGGLEQIWRAYMEIENIAEIYSARIYSRIISAQHIVITKVKLFNSRFPIVLVVNGRGLVVKWPTR